MPTNKPNKTKQRKKVANRRKKRNKKKGKKKQGIETAYKVRNRPKLK